MAGILQTTSNAYSQMKMLDFHLRLFPRDPPINVILIDAYKRHSA